jgi:hypothetical protein
MNGWQSAFQSRFRPEFIQCDIGLFLQYVAHLGAVGFQNPGLASAEVSARANLSCMPTLLDELFNHSQRNLEPPRNLFSGVLFAVVGGEDAFAQVKRERLHETYLTLNINGYIFNIL